MSIHKRVEFSTRDGVTLRGDFFQAADANAPIVVMANGFSLLKELAHQFAIKFQAAGISALAYDFRNYGSSDGLPRQETDLYVQANDFHDAITAGMNLPSVDPNKVVMWGIGHGASAVMISAGNDPRLKAVIMHAPFPSGTVDTFGFPKGIVEKAWKDRELLARDPSRKPGYHKVWRDWEIDGQGDETEVFIRGAAAFHLSNANKSLAAAAGTPWENQVTLQTFLNLISTEPQDHVYKIKKPTLYMVNDHDPFSIQPPEHKKIFERMGSNAKFEVIAAGPGEQLGDQLSKGIDSQIAWLRTIL